MLHMLSSPEPVHAVVGIGASAGGIGAIGELLSTFTHDGTAFVVVMHLSPTFASELASVFAKSTVMKVVRAQDGQRVRRNEIYVIPEYFDIVMSSPETLALVEPHEPRPRRTIDHFFRSLADLRGSNAVGMVLSGMGHDGGNGLRAIKQAGGSTFVQAPSSASHPDMPRNALVHADHCAAPHRLGELLMEMLT